MWYLLVMTCSGFFCSEGVVISTHATMEQCEIAMDVEFRKIKKGQALMCKKDHKEELST